MSRYKINAGEFRHPIIIQRLIGIQDSYGQETEKWIDVYSVHANINPIAGREFFAAERNNSEVSHKIRIRFLENITPSMRVAYQNRVFTITSVINEYERNKVLLLMCKELI